MKYILIILLLTTISFAQNTITITGDSLVGKVINDEAIREVYGNVVLVQGNVRITCNRAIQFISRNDAELIGNVVVTQDNLTITTPKGFYYGNARRAWSNSGIKLDDKKVILTAKNGEYLFNDNKAIFEKDVKIFDTVSTVTSNHLTYFRMNDSVVAFGNVKVVDPSNVITADTLIYLRLLRNSFAFSNVQITNLTNNVTIYGHHLEDYGTTKYSKMEIQPILVQIDTSFVKDSLGNVNPNLDTLIIKARILESYRDSSNKFIATDSVEVWRGGFASKNSYTILYRNENKIITAKLKNESPQPVLWFDNSQLTGDSINIFLKNNRIDYLEVFNNSFILSSNNFYPQRLDQISGDKIFLFFKEGDMDKTEVYGTVYSIYYMYDQNNPKGLTKSSSARALIDFENKRVSEVKLYGSPVSEFHPENIIKGKESTFLLPKFIYIEDKPQKNNLLNGIYGKIDIKK